MFNKDLLFISGLLWFLQSMLKSKRNFPLLVSKFDTFKDKCYFPLAVIDILNNYNLQSPWVQLFSQIKNYIKLFIM